MVVSMAKKIKGEDAKDPTELQIPPLKSNNEYELDCLTERPPFMMNAKQTAEHFGVSERTVRRRIKSKKLRFEQSGKGYQIWLADAELVFPPRTGGKSIAARTEELEKVVSRLKREVDGLRSTLNTLTLKQHFEESEDR
jgi:excisionase family DNA binding protein